VLVSLQGSRAVLDVEVSRAAFTLAALPTGTPALPSQRRAPDPTILAKMRVTERNPNSYEVNAADMQALMENADRVVLDLLPKVRPMFSMEKGLSYHLSGPAGEGTLSSEGFTITSLKIANRIGLEAGDTILRINGRPVDGFASAFRIYFEIRRDPSRPTITVDLLRKGLPLTKAYRIR
jgi:hypothetical protein